MVVVVVLVDLELAQDLLQQREQLIRLQ